MDKFKPIGIFDSGVGGLSVLKQFLKYLPFESYIYLGDTARVPYGNKSKETIREYARECANFLLEKDVKLIVIACHTVSSVALDVVENIANVPVVGMIEPATKSALVTSKNRRIGVIGTRATINSNSYSKSLSKHFAGNELEIFTKACPLFVPLAEEGFITHQSTKLIAEEYLAELRNSDIDTLILGCTHYPLLSKVISETLPDVELIDSGEQAAIYSIRLLAERNALVEEKDKYFVQPDVKFYLTDIPITFPEIARTFLGYEIRTPDVVTI